MGGGDFDGLSDFEGDRHGGDRSVLPERGIIVGHLYARQFKRAGMTGAKGVDIVPLTVWFGCLDGVIVDLEVGQEIGLQAELRGLKIAHLNVAADR